MPTEASESDLLEALPIDEDRALTEPEQHAPSIPGRPQPLTTVPVARVSASFSRIITLDADRLDNLPRWWQRRAVDGRVTVARRLSLDAPRPAASGTWRMPGRLRSPWLHRSISVELIVWPWLGAWVKMTLEPRRRVVVGRRYFSRGHRALEVLGDSLIRELRNE
jgi:hypothetical protein